MQIITATVTMTFEEPLLGCASNNPDVHAEHIASKNPNVEQRAEEVAAIPKPPEEEFKKAMTVFPRNPNGLFLWDYHLKGFFKENIGILVELGADSVKGLSKWQYKRAVDNFIRVIPRCVYLRKPGAKKDDADGIWKAAPETLTRPLRADTLQGERIALATSEVLPKGTWLQFDFQIITGDNKKSKSAILNIKAVEEAIDFASQKGFGQWRNGGYGRFTWSGDDRFAKAMAEYKPSKATD